MQDDASTVVVTLPRLTKHYHRASAHIVIRASNPPFTNLAENGGGFCVS